MSSPTQRLGCTRTWQPREDEEANPITSGNSSSNFPVYETHLHALAKPDIRDANFHYPRDDRVDDDPAGRDIAVTVPTEGSTTGNAPAPD